MLVLSWIADIAVMVEKFHRPLAASVVRGWEREDISDG
jgi:hypothetical protein